MYCPECQVEYRDGFVECADCRVPLVAELPPPAAKLCGDPDLELVTVLEGNNPLAIALAKTTLQEAGIPFYVLGEEISVRIQVLSPLIHPWCRIQVARDREAEARALLQPLEEAESAGGIGDERNSEPLG